MKFVIDIPIDYINDTEETLTLKIPYYLKGGISKNFFTTIILEPYEEPERKEPTAFDVMRLESDEGYQNAKNDIIEALEILRDNMIEVGDTFAEMIESMRRENG